MPSREKRVRRRHRKPSVLPALIVLLALIAVSLTVLLINSDPLSDADDNRLPFSYPENPNFVEQKNATAAPLVLGVEATLQPQQYVNGPTATPMPEIEAVVDVAIGDEPNRFVPEPAEGDYFLPVFDRALRTPDDEAMIAVTVDDCTNADVMGAILTIAQKYNAKLTLFPTGEALMTPGMTDGFKSCVRSYKYQLENHSYAHKAEYKLTSSELAIQLWKQSIATSYAVGRDYEQHFYRPYNKNSAYDQRTHYYIGKLGYEGIATYTHSYSEFSNIDEMVDSLGNGKIYQFDMSEDSMALFEMFVAESSRKGYKLVTMNELFDLNEDVVGETLTIDQQTLISMEDYVPTYYDLKLNYRTNAVYALQSRLIALGYLAGEEGKEAKADGIYGPSTSIAVSAFQARVGIPATGNATAETQEKLFAPDAPAV